MECSSHHFDRRLREGFLESVKEVEMKKFGTVALLVIAAVVAILWLTGLSEGGHSLIR